MLKFMKKKIILSLLSVLLIVTLFAPKSLKAESSLTLNDLSRTQLATICAIVLAKNGITFNNSGFNSESDFINKIKIYVEDFINSTSANLNGVITFLNNKYISLNNTSLAFLQAFKSYFINRFSILPNVPSNNIYAYTGQAYQFGTYNIPINYREDVSDSMNPFLIFDNQTIRNGINTYIFESDDYKFQLVTWTDNSYNYFNLMIRDKNDNNECVYDEYERCSIDSDLKLFLNWEVWNNSYVMRLNAYSGNSITGSMIKNVNNYLSSNDIVNLNQSINISSSNITDISTSGYSIISNSDSSFTYDNLDLMISSLGTNLYNNYSDLWTYTNGNSNDEIISTLNSISTNNSFIPLFIGFDFDYITIDGTRYYSMINPYDENHLSITVTNQVSTDSLSGSFGYDIVNTVTKGARNSVSPYILQNEWKLIKKPLFQTKAISGYNNISDTYYYLYAYGYYNNDYSSVLNSIYEYVNSIEINDYTDLIEEISNKIDDIQFIEDNSSIISKLNTIISLLNDLSDKEFNQTIINDYDIDVETNITNLIDGLSDNLTSLDLTSSDYNLNNSEKSNITSLSSSISDIFDIYFDNGLGIMVVSPFILAILGLIL